VLRKVFHTEPALQHIAILETPAGFQPNSQSVAQEIADAFSRALPEVISHIDVIPARSRETWTVSPDNPDIIAPISVSNCLFLGPGSPSYAVSHLSGTRALEALDQQWQRGAMLVLSSAALLAAGAFTLPVYEIYKVGTPLHWLNGLDVLEPVLPNVALVGHWNNADGGATLDTSCCYMGAERFARLLDLLPAQTRVLGIDERTGVIIDPRQRLLAVVGKGQAHVIGRESALMLGRDCLYSLDDFLPIVRPSVSEYFAPRRIVQSDDVAEQVSETVQYLIDQRARARQAGDYAAADAFRSELEQMGYSLQDTKTGVVVRAARSLN
jgi:cyanophycinase-like exopeptidase